MGVPLPVLRVPIIGAPMAGVSTPELVAAVADAGGLGFLAGGYLDLGSFVTQLGQVSALTSRPYGVNLFVPEQPLDTAAGTVARARVAAYAERLRAEASAAGVALPEPSWDEARDYATKVAALRDIAVAEAAGSGTGGAGGAGGADGAGGIGGIGERGRMSPDVVSFTFGCPAIADVEALHGVGMCVAVTVTTPAEARAAAECGADVLIVQGHEAGGHRATHHVTDEPSGLDHLALLDLLRDVGLPLIAAGGVTTPGDVRRALDAGAVAVQIGTALLLTDEAGTSAAHRMALTDPALTTCVTRAFSGRPARGLRNRFVDEHDAQAPAVYPQVHQLTAALRSASAARGDLGGVALWAGLGWRAAQEGPAADVIGRLARTPTPPGPRP